MKDPKEMTIEEISVALDNLAHIDRMTREDTSYLNAINLELRKRREKKEEIKAPCILDLLDSKRKP